MDERTQCSFSREGHGVMRQCELPEGHGGDHVVPMAAGPRSFPQDSERTQDVEGLEDATRQWLIREVRSQRREIYTLQSQRDRARQERDNLRELNESVAVCAHHVHDIICHNGCVVCDAEAAEQEAERLKESEAAWKAQAEGLNDLCARREQEVERLRKKLRAIRSMAVVTPHDTPESIITLVELINLKCVRALTSTDTEEASANAE